MRNVMESKNCWKCTNHTAPNRGAWSMFHPPPTEVELTITLKEKSKLQRCTNWLVSQNYCSFWRTPPPVKNDLEDLQKLNYSNSGETWLYGCDWPNMGYKQRTFST